MTLDTVIMLFGGFVAVLPFLQFPQDWNAPLSVIAGVVIVGLGIVVRRRSHAAPQISSQPSPQTPPHTTPTAFQPSPVSPSTSQPVSSVISQSTSQPTPPPTPKKRSRHHHHPQPEVKPVSPDEEIV
jgi:hypothetical protein